MSYGLPSLAPSCLVLAISLTLCSAKLAAQDDALNYRPGLIGTYTDQNGNSADRVDRMLAFDWRRTAPDPRIRGGKFSATWHGYLMSQASGDYQLHVYACGQVEIELNGKVVVRGQSSAPTWFSSERVNLAFDWHPLSIRYAPQQDDARCALYWSGPKFQLEPVPTRHLYHDPARAPDDRFARGARLARALRCAGCHADSADPLPAPALQRLSGHVHDEWLVEWLTDHPPGDNDLLRRMPGFGLSQADASGLAAALLAGPLPQQKRPRKGDPKKGMRLARTLGCLACHQIEGLGQRNLFDGGDLSQIAAKRPAGFFSLWLERPEAINPQHRMPSFELSGRERADLSAYLRTLGKTPASSATRPTSSNNKLVARGRSLLNQLRCAGCHALQEQLVGSKPPQLARLDSDSNWRRSCLNDPDLSAGQPGYRLAADDRAALREYFVHRAPGAAQQSQRAGRQLLVENNCLACHARDGQLGLAPKLARVAEADGDLAPLLPAMTPPALTSVGDKLHAQALREAILRKNEPHRSYLQVRMPRFRLSDSELDRLIDLLIASDRIPKRPDAAAAAEPTEAAMKVAGARLVTTNGFGCASCHPIGHSVPPPAPLNARGPDLSLVGKRIRRSWYDRFVRNPARIAPRMEMPSVQLPVQQLLDENIDHQLAAVWYVLNQPDFQPPRPDAIRFVRRSGVAGRDSRAAVLTDVLRTAEHQFIKPLLVGLANRQNVLFDLERGRLAGWWVGDVAYQQTQGKTWYWEPGGVSVVPFSTGPSELHLIAGSDSVAADRVHQFVTEADYWQHVSGGLEFGYRLSFPASASRGPARIAHIVERLEPVTSAPGQPSGFRREIQVRSLDRGQVVGLLPLATSMLSTASVSTDGRQLALPGTAAVRIRAELPSDASFQNDGALLGSANQEGSVTFALEYLTSLPEQPFEQPVVAAAESKPEKLQVVPGCEAIQLPLRDKVMPIALGWTPAGELILGSLNGRVWLAHDTDGDQLEDQLQQFSDELAAPYGVAGHAGYIDVVNKYGLLRLFDDDKDGRADRTQIVASGWGHTADYHDWAVGLPADESGRYYVALPCQQDERSPAGARYRGTVIRLVPREPTADNPRLFEIHKISGGHRFPMGIARNQAGQLVVTDNQGNYNPFNELNHVRQGARFGFINALERAPEFSPPLTPPAIDIPHPWTRSVNGICFLESSAANPAIFGPFAGHLIGCEYDTRRLVRMSLEQVGQTLQGAIYPFSYDEPPEGPAMLGPISCAVAPDGDLYIGNIRDSGWGGANNVGSVVRLRFLPDRLPVGISEVRARPDGFAIHFTAPVDPDRATDPANFSLSSYTRDSTPAYGGEDRDRRVETVKQLRVSDDRLRVDVTLERLRANFVYEFRLKNLSDRAEFFPAEAFYTLREIPR